MSMENGSQSVEKIFRERINIGVMIKKDRNKFFILLSIYPRNEKLYTDY